jgi:hypothetical protein
MKLSSRNEKKTLCEVSSLSSGVSRRNVIIMCQNRASGRHIVCSNYISLAYSRHLSTATQHRRVKQTYVNIVKRILPHIFFKGCQLPFFPQQKSPLLCARYQKKENFASRSILQTLTDAAVAVRGRIYA